MLISASRVPLAGEVLEGLGVEQRLVNSRRWRVLIYDSGAYGTTFSTRRLRSALAIGRA